ncbi:MAG TPA: hypothetical protein VHB21_19765, partial [Minicystis sp.]|nr:hypothetical protein [Minicystis sp.]
MTIVGLILLIIIGAICGAIAEAIVGFSPGGFLASAVVGFLGAWSGTWIAHEVHLPGVFAVTVEGYTIEVVWAIVGAIVLL